MGLIDCANKVSQHLGREMEKTFFASGLNFSSFDVLATLRCSGPPYLRSPCDLSATRMIISGTMTKRCRTALKRPALVERRLNPDDRGSFIVSLNDKGFAATVTDHIAMQMRIVSMLKKQEQAVLDALLSKFCSVSKNA